ncbi:MAG: hypothetical protein EOO39_03080 [Cytophagaceae bacterium]|nr:MAG: hypothetical protein EOO39_03080 [Cytophagaceae bacterium]
MNYWHTVSLLVAMLFICSFAVSNPADRVCPTATFSYTATGVASVALTNQGASASGMVTICAGNRMTVSQLSSNVSTSSLRFIETLSSNGNVLFTGSLLPLTRNPQDYSVAGYFGRTYGPYTLSNPTVSGTLSETFTPYIDLNGNQQYDSTTECLGTPTVLSYEIKPSAFFSYTATGSSATTISNIDGPTSNTIIICAGGNMAASQLTTSFSKTNLRFLEATRSNGNVVFTGYPVPVVRTSQDLPSSYFNQIYGPYTLINPEVTGTLSETFTPYVDLNNNRQYDSATECLGSPIILNYEIRTNAPQASIQTGLWSTQAVWSCNRLPTSLESALVRHTVTIPNSYVAQVKSVIYQTGGLLVIPPTGKLKLYSIP